MWCPLDGCDDPISQRGKTTVQSQSVCTVQVCTQPWAQHRHELSRNFDMSVNVTLFPDYGHIVAGIFEITDDFEKEIKQAGEYYHTGSGTLNIYRIQPLYPIKFCI